MIRREDRKIFKTECKFGAAQLSVEAVMRQMR
jgi:hypothetical protein